MVDPLKRLVAGARAFQAVYYQQRPERIRSLIQSGQRPEVMVIACSDSRVDPAILMNVEPGELFVVRNVANLVPPYQPDGSYHGTSAALEFGVRDLKVRHVIVLGHSRCGGINALVNNMEAVSRERDFIAPWMSILRDGCTECTDGHNRLAEMKGIRISMDNLLTFPWLAEMVEEGKISLHGWYWELDEGMLWGYDRFTEEFTPLL
ncbi:carbonic anhydrase [Telmatospirillum sp. J64-1]|uniref:carbonic anhydrase n=1 Tax=Telmatospirillum sp. J64-1 TaxID=2502183 RepID=UPI00115D0845|nr:carbonic anhydrase [Telmatospirillum sp. J64-1]